MKNVLKFSLLCLYSFSCTFLTAQEQVFFAASKRQKPQEFFQYQEGNSIIISGHRGGRAIGYPENSLEGFQNALTKMPLFFEIDPRLTKDSIIVLMHDKNLDRTTTGKGLLNEYTWAELQDIRLKDYYGNVTDCKIPLLEDVIKWTKGKTVINLDKKDVPFQMIVDIIKKHQAENYVMITVHTGAQARYYYDRLPNIMFSAFCRNQKEFDDMMISGVPWDNMIAYVGPTIDEKNAPIVEQLRKLGVKCMISLAPNVDKLTSPIEREEGYKKAILLSPDIIESDIPDEVWQVLQKMKEER